MSNHSTRGRRNRQRGAELQRESVRMAKAHLLDAHNRDRGGAQHEMGDVEIEGRFYGCKRRKAVPAWVKPEKQEDGVIFREDRQEPQIAIPLEVFLELLQIKHKGYTDENSAQPSKVTRMETVKSDRLYRSCYLPQRTHRHYSQRQV
jgi:hypothetical protein